MSGGDYTTEEFANDLLAGLGGEPCVDCDEDEQGVWLPQICWQDICRLIEGNQVAASIARTGRICKEVMDAYEQTERGARHTDIASNPLRCVR